MNKVKSQIKSNVEKLEGVFPKAFFWDVDLENFSLENWEDRSFIIQRVLNMSDLQDGVLDNLEKLFPVEEIKYYAKDSKEIMGNEIIEKLCVRYNMNPSLFPHYFENIKDFMHA